MAQITGLQEMQRTLKAIEGKIKSLENLNLFLQSQNPTNEYTVGFAKTKATLFCDKKETVDALVKAYKDKIVAEIETLAKDYSITLDETDRKIMHELFVPNKKNPVLSE